MKLSEHYRIGIRGQRVVRSIIGQERQEFSGAWLKVNRSRRDTRWYCPRNCSSIRSVCLQTHENALINQRPGYGTNPEEGRSKLIRLGETNKELVQHTQANPDSDWSANAWKLLSQPGAIKLWSIAQKSGEKLVRNSSITFWLNLISCLSAKAWKLLDKPKASKRWIFGKANLMRPGESQNDLAAQIDLNRINCLSAMARKRL